MHPDTRPITVTTLLSLALHASALFGLVHVMKPVTVAEGRGISIELVDASYVSSQRETEQAASNAASAETAPDKTRNAQAEQASAAVAQALQNKAVTEPAAEPLKPSTAPANASESIDRGAGEKVLTRSTDTAGDRRSIVTLLHSRISERKQYPYMARRQRREGTARVEFVLHPDGSVNAARLVHSSKTRILDRAALEAVQRIAPFEPAKDYLERPEAFQVDVVFNMI